MEMEGISCFQGFDLNRRRERLRLCSSRTGGLPNFDHSGKYPCTVILSSVTLSEAMCAAIRLPPTLALSHPDLFYYLIFSPIFFFVSGLFTSSIHLPLKALVRRCPPRWTDGKRRKRRGVQGASFSLNFRRPGSRATFFPHP